MLRTCIPISLQEPLLIFYIRRNGHKVSISSLYYILIQHLPIREIDISQKPSVFIPLLNIEFNPFSGEPIYSNFYQRLSDLSNK